MLRDVFYYGQKPNVHPREKPAKNLEDARQQATTEHFWIVNEYCDYTNFDWDFDFDFLPDDQVYAEDHNNVWPSQHCKDSGTWLCSKKFSDTIIYREDVPQIKRKNIKTEHWKILEKIDEIRFDFSWHPDPTSPPYIYRFGCRYYPATHKPVLEYHVEGATNYKYMDIMVELLPDWDNWKILHDIDKESFDFGWRPDPTSPPYIYVWGNQHHPGTEMPTIEYHVPGATERNYIDPVWYVKLKHNPNRFEIFEDFVDFDFSWVPHPDSPPYIYVWGNQWNKPEDKASVIYKVDGATEYKYMPERVTRRVNKQQWVIPNDIDCSLFDFSWEPNPNDGRYVYQFGTQHQKTGGPRYVVEGATEVKYVDTMKVKKLSDKSKFKSEPGIQVIDFDYSWHPDDNDEPYIYVFGNQHYPGEIMPTVKYIVEGATELKYIPHLKAKIGINSENWQAQDNIDLRSFNFDWIPHPKDPPYIYEFGTQWQETGGPRYVVPGATEIKYIGTHKAISIPTTKNWEIPSNIDVSEFDFSWHPDSRDEPYIYQFGTQWQKTGGPRYVVPGATQTKFVDGIKAKHLPDRSKFTPLINNNIDFFDYSWHPDSTEEPYNYIFGNQHHSARQMPTIEYRVEGATKEKYVDVVVAHLAQNKENWIIPENIDVSKFDFSWIPNPHDQAYIYEFNTQWQKNGGPRYVVEGATETKYMYSDKAIAKPTEQNWQIIEKIKHFDFSWHPDNTEHPYIYVFGNNRYPAEIMPTVKYVVPGATEFKYINEISATLDVDMSKWIVPHDIDTTDFDFEWIPDPGSPPYIYQFGTQWQKTGGPRYVVKDATEVKYIDTHKATKLSNKENWIIPSNIDIESFDFSWHPDSTEEPYIYEFATVWNDVGGPIYHTPNATQKKYIKHIQAKMLPDKKNYAIKLRLEPDGFDFSWKPHPEAPPYIYVFGNQWNNAERETTIEYIVPGATEYKYINDIIARVAPDKSNFEILIPIVESEFDFSWRPDPYDDPFIYVFGNTQYPGEVMPTVRYVVQGATEIKYIDIIKAKLAPNMKNWFERIRVDKERFDFSWRPDPTSPPYIYVFGNQWNKGNIEHTLEYRTPGATEYKYIEDVVAYVLPDKKNFKILHPIVEDSFDFSWRPNPKEEPYIYAFGNNQYPAEKMPTVLYTVRGAKDYKYDNTLKATLLQNFENFKEIIPVDRTSFDFSWVPDPHEDPYVYVFGNQWNGPEIEPTLEYHVKGATQRKYMTQRAKVLPDYNKWVELIKVRSNFDYSWRPDPTSPPYIYVFGNQWNSSEVEPTIEYHVPSAVDRKYINDIIAEVASDKTNWIVPEGINVDDFDFSWRPNPGSPPYIYQFGTLLDDNDGPRYVPQKNNGEIIKLQRVMKKYDTEFVEIPKYYIATTLEDLIKQHPDELFWALRKNINYSNFNFSWRPNIEQARYVHVFGSPDAVETQTYFVSSKLYNQGFTKFNFITEEIKAESEYLAELFIQPDIFMIDRGNPEAKERFEKLKERFPTIQKARYLNGWVDTIYRCLNKCKTDLAWILNSELDYSNFDFKYYPNPWQMKMVHIFGTQWSHWGTTYLINKTTFPEDTKYVKIIEHLNNLNFVKNRVAKATNCLYDVYLIDHGNLEIEKIKNQLNEKITGKSLHVIPYRDSYLKTLKDIISTINIQKEHYIWVCSSICDYNNFDLSYICDPFAKDNLHVFPSDRQKFGDTFLVDVNKLSLLINDMNLLEDYEKINYNQHLRANRISCPVIINEKDTHSNVKDFDFNFPYAIIKTSDNTVLNINYDEPISLWAQHTKNVEILSTGGTAIVVPSQAKDYCQHDVYDYPYITKTKKIVKSQPLDIVYLSNGEKAADENYEHLLKVVKHLPNRIVRVDGVNGRVQAYHAAAEASNTPWMFTVFAKLKVNEKFDWSWQPDRLQVPKHYIFNALNPVNGLIYGHQAMIAYNKKIVLNNTGKGLDFTLDDEHEVVDMLSGTANFNTDPYSTWRTAFREVIKLKSDFQDISFERLNTWLTIANGPYAQDCLQGAKDGVEYYMSVDGDIDQLKLSYEWDWLKDYYNRKYK